MFTKRNIILAAFIGATLLLIAGYSSAKATKTYVTGTAYSLMMGTIETPPIITPSGNIMIRQQEGVEYDDYNDDRFNGYTTNVFKVIINHHGDVQVEGISTTREKLDDIPVEDLINLNFDPNDIVQGEIIWEGHWSLKDDCLLTGVLQGRNRLNGLKFFFDFIPFLCGDGHITTYDGYILDPHGE